MNEELKELIEQVKANTAALKELTEMVKADKTITIDTGTLKTVMQVDNYRLTAGR